jgi:hypothetical protein
MNKFKALLIMGVVGALFATLAVTAFAAKSTTDLSENSWKVYNGEPAANSFWDINKAQPVISGGVTFPIQQFLTKSTGSFAIYLLTNYNVDLTEGKTITAAVNWTAGTYETRSTAFTGAFVRLEFQDVTASSFTSSDYWWYTGNLDLNAVASGTLTAPLTDRANWTNICGQSATDTTPHPGLNCVGTTDPAVSPYDGFSSAMKNVKQVGLSFGSSGSYASGVALDGGPGTFNMTSFTVAP